MWSLLFRLNGSTTYDYRHRVFAVAAAGSMQGERAVLYILDMSRARARARGPTAFYKGLCR